MRVVHARRLSILGCVVFALLSAVQAMAAVDAYIIFKSAKQGPVKGEALNERIPLVSVERTSAMAREASSGMATGRRQHSDITITKKIDMASPKLAQAASTNETFSEVEIGFPGGSGDAKSAQKIILTDAVILSVRKAGGNEQITLSYRAIEVTYANGGKTMADDWSTPK